MGPERAGVDWLAFLDRWNRDVFRSNGAAKRLPGSVRAAGWLGYPGASDEELDGLESRLGRPLPESYRSFLRVSNGWHHLSPGADTAQRLWSTREIDWFVAKHR